MNFWDLGKAKEQDLPKFNETTKEVIIIDLTLHSTNLYIEIKKPVKNYHQFSRFVLVACG